MRPTTFAPYLKLGAAAAIIGAIAAGAISFAMPRSYVSSAVMRFAPPTVAGKAAWQIEIEAAHSLQEIQAEILSRTSLAEMIQRPGLDLYREQRASDPMQEVIQEMRSRDLRIERLPPRDLRISFEYPDPVKAQAVVRELSTRFSGLAELLTPATLPETPSQPDRLASIGIGSAVGLALGLLLVFLRRRGLKWTLGMAGGTVAGCLLALALCLLLPDTFADDRKTYQFLALGAFTGLVAGAFRWRNRNTAGNRYARLIAFSAACGAITGGLVSFALPERYISAAVLRAVPFSDGGVGPAQPEVEPAERLEQLTGEILSRGSLNELILRPSLDLYREERQRHPMEDVIQGMRRRDVRIAPAPPTDLNKLADPGPIVYFQISFEYPDRDKAQAVVRELVTKFIEGNVNAQRKLETATAVAPGAQPKIFENAHASDRTRVPGSLALEVIDAASLPDSPVSPNRLASAAIGLLAGLLVGSLLGLRLWLAAREAATPGPRPSYWKYTFAAAAIGALAFGLGSFVISNRYVSTAVLQVVPFAGGGARTAEDDIESTERLRRLNQDVLSRASLAELILRPSLDLYRKERQRDPLAAVIDEMRSRDIRIAPTPVGLAAPGHPMGFEISFESPDRDKAQAVVRELVTKLTEGNVAAERSFHRDRMPGSAALEVIDAASLPEAPVSPNRLAMAAVGLLAGMLLGPFLARRRQQRANRLPALPPDWNYALPAAILGWALASFAYHHLPNRYSSTAVLRLTSADPRAAENVQGAAAPMPEIFQQVLNRDSLAEIILSPSLQLYAPDRARRSLDQVIEQMRQRDLHVEPLRDSVFGGRPTAFRISFAYSDGAKAQACVQALVSKFVEALPPPKPLEDSPPVAPYLEVLDPAEVHKTPDNFRWAALGGLAGLLLGIAISRARRRAPHPAPA